MLTMTADELRARARALAAAINAMDGFRATLVGGASAVGGGSAPGVDLPSELVAVERSGLTPDALEERLRRAHPPIIARIEHNRVLFDLRTVSTAEEPDLIAALRSVASP
jgi:L-seryl-tRNA(Ser) seleniumtransferase